MYIGCKHDGKDISALASSLTSTHRALLPGEAECDAWVTSLPDGEVVLEQSEDLRGNIWQTIRLPSGEEVIRISTPALPSTERQP